MSRIILICSVAALLMGGGCANAIKNANQTDWGQARLACADVGIDPATPLSASVSSISTTRCGMSRMRLETEREARLGIERV